MTRRVFLLNGLAILAVVCNHAGAWGYTAMFWWTDSYRPVTTPNFDQFGSPAYYGLLVVRQLAVFAVPAFLFVSGVFISYTARSASAMSWKMIRTRIVKLLIPYFIWSLVIFFVEFLEGTRGSPGEYLRRLVTGGAHPAYFFVPVLCQFYLLSPWIVAMARKRVRLLLVASALLSLGVLSVQYLSLVGALFTDAICLPALGIAQFLTASWLFVAWTFFFALGVVSGLHFQQLGPWLIRYRWGLLAAVVLLGLLTIIEVELVFRRTGEDWRGSPRVLSGSLYAVAFVLCFLAFRRTGTRRPAGPASLSGVFQQLGRRSYGIYLLHPKVLEFGARALRLLVPWVLAYQVLFQPLLVLLGVGGPLLFMTLVARSPGRKAYRYLFG